MLKVSVSYVDSMVSQFQPRLKVIPSNIRKYLYALYTVSDKFPKSCPRSGPTVGLFEYSVRDLEGTLSASLFHSSVVQATNIHPDNLRSVRENTKMDLQNTETYF